MKILMTAVLSISLFASFSAFAEESSSIEKQIFKWSNGETLSVDLEAPKPIENDESRSQGRAIYELTCVICHGRKGDGTGHMAHMLTTQPRDFTRGVYKFRSTPNGKLPTNEDLFKTVSRGLHGTAMPPWLVLNTEQKWSIVYYIKTFSNRFKKYENKNPEIVKVPDPSKTAEVYINQGKNVYKKGQCGKCHGAEASKDGITATDLVDEWNQPTPPTNFRLQSPKRGLNIEDLYLTISTGLNGAPMPSFSGTLTPDEIMALAYYIKSVAPKNLTDMGRQQPLPDEIPGMRIMMNSMGITVVPQNRRLGISIQGITTPEMAQSLKLPDTRGALVEDISKGSRAEKSALKIGDVIVKFNDTPIIIMADLPKIVAETPPDSKITIEVLRDGKKMTIEVPLAEK